MKAKKAPERRCVGCGESFPKSSLIGIVRTPEGEVVLDVTGRKNGRGAYICKSAECFRTARKKNRFSTNLSAEIPEEIFDRLEREIAACEKEATSST
ncbi:MAG: YlxR family protein [Clostridia bacterium]|nr:YlxR family protein [Clostridia bacterium]